ncbi:ABC transporter permease subunit [Peribacillus butanolivorans]|uniref:ABC transporter permease subunit n=1 Tax=Peribacillus butanolivorans TaxID=421767 RepID=UPI0036DA6C7C
MNNLRTLLYREIVEMFREYKLLWLPIAFIGIGILQPLSMKLLPTILAGQEGIIIDSNSPASSGDTIYSGVYSQFNQFGLIIIAISLMGTVFKEKKEGILSSLFTKPISVHSYLISKYISNISIIILSLMIGTLSSIYYTNIYFTDVTWKYYFSSLGFYSIWVLFIISVVITMSTILKSQIQVAVAGIGIPSIFLIVNGFSNEILELLLPSSLSVNGVAVMTDESLTQNWPLNIAICLILIVALYIMSYISLKKKNLEC